MSYSRWEYVKLAVFIAAMTALSIFITVSVDGPNPTHAETMPSETVIHAQPVAAVATPGSVRAVQAVATVRPTETPEPTPTPAPRTYQGITEGDVIMGDLTHYDVCQFCCGKTDGVTASGLIIANGESDPYVVSCNWLPLGSIVEVDGIRYAVMDRGGRSLDRIGRLDVYVPGGHQAALELGRVKGVEIIIIEIGG